MKISRESMSIQLITKKSKTQQTLLLSLDWRNNTENQPLTMVHHLLKMIDLTKVLKIEAFHNIKLQMILNNIIMTLITDNHTKAQCKVKV